jgi:pyridoxine 5-phosphate synthase
MTKLSVNINKIATLRNARGCSQFIKSSHRQKFGAEGITIHPRPDERHIRYQDARDLKAIVLPNTISKAIRSKHLLILFSK